MNYDDAADRLGISRAEVLKLCVDGKLDVEWHGRDRNVHIDPKQVEDMRGRK